MATTDEIVELLELALQHGKRARRIESELGSTPDHALRIAKATMQRAVRTLEERVPSARPAAR